MIYTKPDREMIRYFPFRAPCFRVFSLLVMLGVFLLYFIHLIVGVKTGILRVDFRVNKISILLKINALLFAYNIKLLYICSVRNN